MTWASVIGALEVGVNQRIEARSSRSTHCARAAAMVSATSRLS